MPANHDTAPHHANAQPTGAGIGKFRWVICALLFFGVTKNYMDRQVLSVLKSTLQSDLGWNEIDYSNLVTVFQAAYALGMLCVGRIMDKLGTRLGYAAAMVFWSVASMAHAAAHSFFSFAVVRAALGFGEAGVFPASIKTIAEWFPKKERALATGLFNAGTSVGPILTPLMVPWIAIHLGWRWAFFLTGALGFVWLIFWWKYYEKPEAHPKCSAAELAYIRSDPVPEPAKVRWSSLLRYRQTWTVAAGKFLTDPVWWFYLFWVPDFLQKKHGLQLMQLGLPILVIYVIADLGSVVGGWISSSLIQRGATVNRGRKTAFLLCALAVTPIVLAYRVSGLWEAVVLIGVAAAAHQGFSANLFTLASDLFPQKAVGSVVGIAGMCGAIGGMLIAKILGYLLQWTQSYRIPFLMAASAYLVALVVMHVLSPKLEPATLPDGK